jgi:hypothetical protein
MMRIVLTLGAPVIEAQGKRPEQPAVGGVGGGGTVEVICHTVG